MDVADHANAVVEWLAAGGPDGVVLVGHSSATRVAAHVAVREPDRVRALVLASPTVDPAYRSMRRVRYALAVHLRDRLEDTVERVPHPVLVLHGDRDRLCTEAWARELGERARDGRFRSVPARTASSGRRPPPGPPR
ncbi:alpha/beta fold hydrolase [Blastococcus sp. SYSU DS0539]